MNLIKKKEKGTRRRNLIERFGTDSTESRRASSPYCSSWHNKCDLIPLNNTKKKRKRNTKQLSISQKRVDTHDECCVNSEIGWAVYCERRRSIIKRALQFENETILALSSHRRLNTVSSLFSLHHPHDAVQFRYLYVLNVDVEPLGAHPHVRKRNVFSWNLGRFSDA